MNTKKCYGQHGMTLIEMTLALAAGFIILAACLSVSLNLQKTTNREMAYGARDDIILHLQQAASNQSGLEVTLQKNPILSVCIKGQPANLNCANNRIYPISLYDPDGSLISGPDSNPNSGKKADPVWYTREAHICTPGDATCVFRVTSSFLVQMVPQAGSYGNEIPYSFFPNASGQAPEVLEIFYDVEAVASVGDEQLTSASGTVFVNLYDVSL